MATEPPPEAPIQPTQPGVPVAPPPEIAPLEPDIDQPSPRPAERNPGTQIPNPA